MTIDTLYRRIKPWVHLLGCVNLAWFVNRPMSDSLNSGVVAAPFYWAIQIENEPIRGHNGLELNAVFAVVSTFILSIINGLSAH